MEDVPEPFVLLNLEHTESPIDRSCPHCDFLFVGGGEANPTEWVVPIELTTGENDAKKFKRQLQPGASLAENLIPDSITVRFLPIAVHEKENQRKAERNRRKNPNFHIEFRNMKIPPKLVKCGESLSQALISS